MPEWSIRASRPDRTMLPARFAGAAREARRRFRGLVFAALVWPRFWTRARDAWVSAASWCGFPARLGRSGRDGARIEAAAHEFQKRGPDLAPQSSFQAAIVLRAAEDITDDVAECGRVIEQLHHARGDRSTQKITAEDFAREV